jgi:murein DD-endopeptidase MepM/ murein hydrolase activator NlpD
MPVRHTDMAKNTNGWTGPNGHDGIDLLTPEDEPLLAMVKSRVVRVSPANWWGNNPRPSPGHPISDGDGIIVLESLVDVGPIKRGLHICYGHGEHATVKVGEIVEAGRVIGKAGWAVVPHVHFMLNDDAPVNGLYRGVGDRDPWMGAGRAITGRWDVASWYEANARKIVLHTDARLQVRNLIGNHGTAR